MWATYRGGSWLGNEPAVLQLQSGDLTKIVSPCISHFCEFRTKPNLLQPQHCGLRHTRRRPCEVLSSSCCSTVRANITEVDVYASMTKRCWICIGWFPMVPAKGYVLHARDGSIRRNLTWCQGLAWCKRANWAWRNRRSQPTQVW